MRLFGLILASIIIFSIIGVQASFAEQILSPRQQLADGITPENIHCRDDRVLVIRSNGNPACVTQKTADRTGWEIISQTEQEIIPEQVIQEIIPEQVIQEIIPRKTIVEFNTPESIPQSIIDDHFNQEDKDVRFEFLRYSAKLQELLQPPIIQESTKIEEEVEELPLESIPKPIGDFVAILPEDQDAFAKRLANAGGEELTNVKKYGESDYYTTDGRIDMIDEGFVIGGDRIFAAVMYQNFKLMKTESEQLEFINNFMNKMGYKLGGNELAFTDESLKTCENNSVTYYCNVGKNAKIYRSGDRYANTYTLLQEYSSIQFIFNNESYYLRFGLPGVEILFNGWTNNPETVVFTLSKQDAVKKAIDFAINDHFLNTIEESFTFIDKYNSNHKSESSTRVCGFQFNSEHEFRVQKIVISDIPYYDVHIGRCLTEIWDGHYLIPTILVEGLTGDKIHTQSSGFID